MIIKQTRIVPRDIENLQKYLVSEDENEEILSLFGNAGDLVLHAYTAKVHGRPYATRHIIIAPEVPLKMWQLKVTLLEIAREFRISAEMFRSSVLVVHKKRRSKADASCFHYHFAVPETEVLTGRRLEAEHVSIRNEKVCRLLELRLGHPVIVGRNNSGVMAALLKAGVDVTRYTLALQQEAIAQGIKLTDDRQELAKVRRYAAFTKGQAKSARRHGIDLAAVAQAFRQIVADDNRIHGEPRKHEFAVQDAVSKLGGRINYNIKTGGLGLRFGDKVLPGLKRLLGISGQRFRDCEMILKEMGLDDEYNKFGGGSPPGTTDP